MAQNQGEEKQGAQYWCFISYRHADNKAQDREWASWLHQEIERYEVPAELVGSENERGDTIPERIYPVFRDEESLPADANLANSVQGALDRSRFLTVLCSPKAVESQYVSQEIDYFIRAGKSDRIIAAIISGEPGNNEKECFPAPLKEGESEGGLISEPIAADFRLPDGSEGFTSAEAYRLKLQDLPKREAKRRGDAYESQLQLMKLKIIAGILGVPLETLRNRDQAYQLVLAQRRSRVLRFWLSAVGILAILAVAGGIFSWNRGVLLAEERDQSQLLAGQGLLLRAKDEALQSNAIFYVARARGFQGFGDDWVGLGDPSESNKLAQDHPVLLSESEKTTPWIQSALRRITNSIARPFIWSSLSDEDMGKPVYQVAWATKGERFAAVCEGAVYIWEKDEDSWGNDWNVVESLPGVSNPLNRVAWSPAGDRLAISVGRNIRFSDTTKVLKNIHQEPVSSLAWSKDGKLLATSSRDRAVIVWNVANWEKVSSWNSPAPVTCLTFDPSANRIAVGSWYDQLTVYDAMTGDEQLKLVGHSGLIRMLDWHKDSRWLLSASDDAQIKLWDTNTGTQSFSWSDHDASVTSVAWNPDGIRFASGSEDKTIRLFDLEKREARGILQGHAAEVSSLSWSRDGKSLITGSKDETVKLWNVSLSPIEPNVTFASDAEITSLTCSTEDMVLVCGCADGQAFRWGQFSNLEKPPVKWQAHESAITSIAQQDYYQTLTGSQDGTMIAWGEKGLGQFTFDPVYGEKEKKTFKTGPVQGLEWIRLNEEDYGMAVLAQRGSSIQIWKPDSDKPDLIGNHMMEIISFDYQGNNIDTSPLIVTSGKDAITAVWDGKSGKQLYEIEGTGLVAWHPEDRIVAFSRDNTLFLWDLTREKPVRKRFNGNHRGTITSIAWTPFGFHEGLLATSSLDRTAKIWNANTMEEIATLNHDEPVRGIAWAEDNVSITGGRSIYTFTAHEILQWQAGGFSKINPKNNYNHIYGYLETGWCYFEEESGDLIWTTPPPKSAD